LVEGERSMSKTPGALAEVKDGERTVEFDSDVVAMVVATGLKVLVKQSGEIAVEVAFLADR
jgi:hypothetical protein